jgi:hypothetical protein
MTFNLPTGRQVIKDAAYCVAVKTRNRWNHQFFKSYKGASNEIKRLRSYSADTVAYYDIQEYKLIKGI